MSATDVPADRSDWRIRPGGSADLGAIADLYLRVRLENLGPIPPVAHDDESVRAYIATVLPAETEIWVADSAGTLLGFMVLRRPDWISQLYVDGAHASRGIGAALVEVAQRELGGPLQLWTFQANVRARAFFERLGFEPVEWTDGDNEEHAPDVRYLRPAQSVVAR